MAVIEYNSELNEQLSAHFFTKEFKGAQYGKNVKISEELITKLELLYIALGATDHTVSSGYRPNPNATGSMHYHGKAVDITFRKNGKVIDSKIVVLIACYAIGFTGIANINSTVPYTYTHLDVRDDGSHWWGDELYHPSKSISTIAGPDGQSHDNFKDWYGVSDSDLQQLLSSASVQDAVSQMENKVNITNDMLNDDGEVVSGPQQPDFAETTEPVVDPEIVSAINKSLDSMFASAVSNMKDVGFTSRFIGAPFRFLKETDPEVKYDTGNSQTTFTEGRGYVYHINAEAPLVHFIPGLPTYLKDFDANNKQALSEYITNKGLGNEMSSSIINRINGIEGRYFDFVPAYADYMKYVNLLCRTSAIYMGIGDRTVPGSNTQYKKYNWLNYQSGGSHVYDNLSGSFDSSDSWSDLINNAGEAATVLVDNVVSKLSSDLFGGYQSVKCYVDSSTSFSEDFSNNTKESMVASLFDTAESAVKELNFWAGGTKTTNRLQEIGSTLASGVDGAAETILGALGLGGSNLDNVGNYAGHIISGSNIIFPEMWGDSSYTKSYNFSITLVSPYGDPESLYLNIIQPMMFLLPLVMPRQTSGNSYTSPFLVRVIAKGTFSCDMGIVEGISIEKGGSDSWNANGMPLEVKLGIRVKDLYTSMSMANTSQPGLYFNNPTLIEFLSTTCGVNTVEPNLSLKVMTLLNMFANMASDIPTNAYSKIMQVLNNTVMNWTRL